MNHAIQGVHCAAATPITADRRPDLPVFADHCRALLDEGCHGIALLGTTGEANSFSMADRKSLVEAAIESGIPADTLLPGTSTPVIADTVELSRHAVDAGARGVVLLPPYYYKGVSDEGLFRFYADVIEGVGDNRLRVVLYHIPQVTQVPITHALIDRLLNAFPGIVCGIKDSSGELENMKAMCERFPRLGVLSGADPLMLPLLRMGGAGCITSTSNLRADALRAVWNGWRNPDRAAEVETAQDRINSWRTLSNTYVQLPTIKAMLAHAKGHPGWLRPMPPLVELDETECRDVWDRMDRLDA
ncbi:MAG: dihydrodipicolinate synthase family protein [Geminicoccaceae bacterium]|nr:dihydrodipicolinate synthase family protein [Geminicoccaceae bacterium]